MMIPVVLRSNRLQIDGFTTCNSFSLINPWFTAYGILAGKRAGMEVCAVKDPYSQGSVKEKKEIADYYINTYYDILDGTYEVLKK